MNHLPEQEKDLSPTLASPQDQILEAAARLILERGELDFSIRDLSQEAGLAKGTIYYHFQGKEAIVLQVLERDMARTVRLLTQAAQSDAPPLRQLQDYVRTYVALAQERRALLLALFQGADKLHLSDLPKLIVRYQHQILAPLVAILSRGMAEGSFRPLPAEATAVCLVGMLHAVVNQILWRNLGSGDVLLDTAMDLITAGLYKEEEEK